MRIVTIGGYGFTEEGFLRALKQAEVDMFVDVRQRRGMRGARYAFLNSARLQGLLAAAGIKYVHALQLAPTTAVREAQKQADLGSGTLKQDRTALSPVFVQKYRSDVLSKFEPASLMRAVAGAHVVALFCVEGHPAACHRSLAAEHLLQAYAIGTPVEHLRP